jgi:hypothetical protein
MADEMRFQDTHPEVASYYSPKARALKGAFRVAWQVPSARTLEGKLLIVLERDANKNHLAGTRLTGATDQTQSPRWPPADTKCRSPARPAQ